MKSGASGRAPTIRPAPRYAASAITEWLLGAGYRHLWVSPVRVEQRLYLGVGSPF